LGLAYLAFHFLPIIIAIFLGPILVAFAVALAFMKYNDKPFIDVVESFIRYYSRSRLYLWHKQTPPVKTTGKANRTINSPILEASAPSAANSRGTMSESKLKTLSWSLDVIDPKK